MLSLFQTRTNHTLVEQAEPPHPSFSVSLERTV